MRSVTISATALAHNLRRVCTYAPMRKVLAMLKANAYGHGLLTVAGALQAADGFGVADINEALQLRKAGFRQPILVMRGFHDYDELNAFAHHDLMAVVHAPAQISLLTHSHLKAPIGVWLKIDTGMHRLGLAPAMLNSAFQQLMACAAVRQPLCVMSHLADADEADPLSTARQWMVFEQALAGIDQAIAFDQSLANSAGIIAYPAIASTWVRPGIMLYGVSPFAEHIGSDYGLLPVMNVKTRLIAIKHVPAGAAIGYGGSFVCPHAMRLGIAAFGYGDGYPRTAPTGTPILVDGQLTRTLGRVSMDLLCVDLTPFPQVQVGSEVTLWGEGLPVERVAARVGTLSYELLCHIQRYRL